MRYCLGTLMATSQQSLKNPYRRLFFFLSETICLTFALLAGFSLCWVYGHSLDDPLDHPIPITLSMFYPSVFFAGGYGLGTASPENIPGLEAFVQRKVDFFDIKNIPASVEVVPISSPLELTNIYHLYAVGIFWRLFGVSISTLLLYVAFLYALSAGALYCLFRNGLGRLSALAGVLLVSSSPALLCMSPILRDFGKTPFVLVSLYILTGLAVRPVSPRKFLGTAVVLGLLLGIAMGFRQDMFIFLPPAAAIFLFFSRIEARHPWRIRFAAFFLFFLLFVPLARPVFKGAALEGNQASVHGFFQGVTNECESRLNFGGASYDYLVWTDSGLYAQANVYARRLGEHDPMDNPHATEYRHAHGVPSAAFLQNPGLYYTGSNYADYQRLLMRDVLWHFPADIAARAWRASVAVYEMPLAAQENSTWVRGKFPEWMQYLFRIHEGLARGISWFGLVSVVMVLCCVSLKRFRIALCLTGLLLWFTGYPSINYDYRFIAYLVFVPIGAFLICLEVLCLRLMNVAKHRLWHHGEKAGEHTRTGQTWRNRALQPFASVFLLVGMIVLAVVLPLGILRWWQETRVSALADTLKGMKRTAIETELIRKESHILASPLAELPGLKNSETLPPGETAWEYVAVVFDTRGRDIPVTIEYDQRRVFNDFTQQLTLWGSKDKEQGLVTFFFPVYEATTVSSPQLFRDFLQTINIPQWREQVDPDSPFEEQPLWKRSKFLGISFPESCQDAFKGFYRVTNVDDLRYLPLFQLPENREDLRTFKSGPWERRLRAYLARMADREGADF